jgi:hypothetical protein
MFRSSKTRSRLSFAILLGLMLAGSGLLASPARAQFGVTAGLNFAQMDDFTSSVQNTSVNAAFDNATGYHVGLVYELGSGRWAVRPAAVFRTIGTYTLPQDPTVGDLRNEFDLQVVEVPVDVKLRLIDLPLIHPYLLAGPVASFPWGEGDFSDATEEIALSANVGGGINIDASWLPVALQAEVRYETGVTDMLQNNFTVGGQTFEVRNEPRNSALSVRLNLLF